MWKYPEITENPFAESSSSGTQTHAEEEDEEALKWAAIQSSPSYIQARISLFKNISGNVSQVDITKLGKDDRNLVLDRLLAAVNDNPEGFFCRLRHRFLA